LFVLVCFLFFSQAGQTNLFTVYFDLIFYFFKIVFENQLSTVLVLKINFLLCLCCRLLTLWFDYGQWPDVYEALTEGIKSIQIDNWLQVSGRAACTEMPVW
jgi:hypothetical protein